jgi:hypothetical protein
MRVPAKAAIAERPEPARLRHKPCLFALVAQPDCGLFDEPRVIKLRKHLSVLVTRLNPVWKIPPNTADGPQQAFGCGSVLPR